MVSVLKLLPRDFPARMDCTLNLKVNSFSLKLLLSEHIHSHRKITKPLGSIDVAGPDEHLENHCTGFMYSLLCVLFADIKDLHLF